MAARNIHLNTDNDELGKYLLGTFAGSKATFQAGWWQIIVQRKYEPELLGLLCQLIPDSFTVPKAETKNGGG